VSTDGESGAGCSHTTADGPSEPGLWNNRAFDISRQNAAGKEAAFDKRVEKLAQVRHVMLTTNDRSNSVKREIGDRRCPLVNHKRAIASFGWGFNPSPNLPFSWGPGTPI